MNISKDVFVNVIKNMERLTVATQSHKTWKLFSTKNAALCAAIIMFVGASNFVAAPARAVAAAKSGTSSNCTDSSSDVDNCGGGGSGGGDGGGTSGTRDNPTNLPTNYITPDSGNTVIFDPFSTYEPTHLVQAPVIGPQGGGHLHTPLSDKPTAAKKQNKNPCPNTAGDPIMVDSGNKVMSVVDFAEPGEMGLKFERYYNSKFDGVTGNSNASIGAWTTNIDFTLFNLNCVSLAGSAGPVNLCSPVRLYRPDGSYLDFSPTNPVYSNPNGSTVQMTGPFKPVGTATLSYNANGTYTVHDEDAKVLIYNSNGLLLSIKDPSSVGWSITHPDANTTVVTHTNGQSFRINLVGATNTLGTTRQVNVTDPAGNVYKFSSTYTIGSAVLTQTSHIGTINSVVLPGSPNTTISYKYLPSTYSPIITDSLLNEVDYNGVPHDVTTYDSAGRANMTGMADGSQKVSVTYGSNSTGKFATLTNALGHSLVYQYNSAGLLITISGNASLNCAASYASNTYDVNGNMASSTDNKGNITQYSYNANGLLLKTIEAAGTASTRTTDYVWDSTPVSDRLLSITVEGYVKKEYTYNAQNRMASIKTTNLTGIGSGASRVTTYTYTLAANQMVTAMVATAPSPNNANTVTSTYDTRGFLTATTDGLGHSTTYSSLTALGLPGRITSTNGDVTNYAYDARGRLINKSHTHAGGTNTGNVSYDANSGRVSLSVQYDNEQTRNIYDADFKLTSSTWTGPSGASIKTTYTYDALGDITSVTRTLAGGSAPAVSAYQDYDELGRVIAQRGNHGQKVTTAYDLNGNVSVQTDAASHNTSVQYDGLNRPITVTNAIGGVTKYEYDLGDHVIKVTDPRNLITSYTYDGFGQRWTTTSPDTGTTRYDYDAYGRLSSKTRNSGAVVNYTYDGLGRVTSESGGGETHTFTYDSCTYGKGHLCGYSDSSGSHTYAYNVEGMISEYGVTNVFGSSSSTFFYDGMNRLLQHGEGFYITTYKWTDDKVAGINFQFNGHSIDVVKNVTYDALRQATGFTYGNGVQRSQTYDSDGRITGIASLAGGTTQQKLTFGWDNVNRIATITNNAYTTVTQNFGYDSLDRVTSQSGPAALALSYDANGNRTQQNGLTNEAVGVSPASNRLNQRGSHVYNYDANGNRQSDIYGGSVLTYTYDAFNRLDSASRSTAVSVCDTTRNCPTYPAGTTDYVYNAIGQRMMKNSPLEFALYSYQLDGELQGIASTANGSSYYLYLNGQPIAVLHNSTDTNNVDTLYYLHDDQLGRPEIITNGSGQKVWQALNYGFDRAILVKGISGIDIGLPGQIYDSETGNWSNGFRDYDSSDGRYLESDPIGLTGGINTYAYVGNNPLSYTDPYGLWALSGSFFDLVGGGFELTGEGWHVASISFSGGVGIGAGLSLDPNAAPKNKETDPCAKPGSNAIGLFAKAGASYDGIGADLSAEGGANVDANGNFHGYGGGGLNGPSFSKPGEGGELEAAGGIVVTHYF